MDMELVFSDLAIIGRRLSRLETTFKGAKPAERDLLLKGVASKRFRQGRRKIYPSGIKD
jgi:hypothetical protein